MTVCCGATLGCSCPGSPGARLRRIEGDVYGTVDMQQLTGIDGGAAGRGTRMAFIAIGRCIGMLRMAVGKRSSRTAIGIIRCSGRGGGAMAAVTAQCRGAVPGSRIDIAALAAAVAVDVGALLAGRIVAGASPGTSAGVIFQVIDMVGNSADGSVAADGLCMAIDTPEIAAENCAVIDMGSMFP